MTLLESRIKRPAPAYTLVTLGEGREARNYHFAPRNPADPHDPHVCEVTDREHLRLFYAAPLNEEGDHAFVPADGTQIPADMPVILPQATKESLQQELKDLRAVIEKQNIQLSEAKARIARLRGGQGDPAEDDLAEEDAVDDSDIIDELNTLRDKVNDLDVLKGAAEYKVKLRDDEIADLRAQLAAAAAASLHKASGGDEGEGEGDAGRAPPPPNPSPQTTPAQPDPAPPQPDPAPEPPTHHTLSPAIEARLDAAEAYRELTGEPPPVAWGLAKLQGEIRKAKAERTRRANAAARAASQAA